MDSTVAQDVQHYLAVVHKRRGIIATSLTVSMLVAVLYNYTTRPLYQATVKLLIDRAAPRVLPNKDMIDQGVQDYQTEYELLRGRRVAEGVVAKLNLQKSPELTTGPLMSPWERFQRRFLGRTTAADVGSDGIPLSPAAAALRSRITVEPQPGGRLVNLRVSAYDPTLAAQIANALADTYIEQTMQFRFTASSEATDWLSDHMADQKRKVEDAEKALLAYQERHGLTDMGSSGSSDKATAIDQALLTARAERIAKETLLAQVRTMTPSQLASVPGLSVTPGVQDMRSRVNQLQSEQARLAETLGERHPDMVRLRGEIDAAQEKLQGELRSAVHVLEAEVLAARAKEATLDGDLDRARREGLEVGRKAIEYEALKREVDTNKQLFQSLMSRAKETGLESELRATNVRVQERAEPPGGPSSPQRQRNYQIAFIIGLALGIGLAFVFEQADSTIKTPEEIKQMGLPFLGMVPAVPMAGPAGSLRPSALKNPEGAVAEAYRVLRTNLMFTAPSDVGRAVLVSSASPGEGKTTTVANVATALALNGARVLVIDADLRRPALHQQFGIGKMPGLSDLIIGRSAPSQTIQITRHKGLHVIPCGYAPPNPAELLGSSSMREIVSTLKKHYDWVLIDTPPILAMADTAILCPLVDGVILVLAAEATSRPAVQRSLDQIQAVGGRVMGTVLNKVDLKRNSYYYSHYYGEYYRSYYAETAPRPAASGPRPVRRR